MKPKNRNRTHRDLLIGHQRNRCCYCECKLLSTRAALPNGKIHPQAATIEHLKRRADGGTHGLHNKAVACHSCNTGRGATDWLTYKSIKMGEIVTPFLRADLSASTT